MHGPLPDAAAASYRALVHEHPRFIDYFRVATPSSELTRMNIGSRPGRRPGHGDDEASQPACHPVGSLLDPTRLILGAGSASRRAGPGVRTR